MLAFFTYSRCLTTLGLNRDDPLFPPALSRLWTGTIIITIRQRQISLAPRLRVEMLMTIICNVIVSMVSSVTGVIRMAFDICY